MTKRNDFGLIAWLLSLLGSVGLIVIGLAFILDNADAAKLFGVPLTAGSSAPYVSVAAVRDVAVGAITLIFVLLCDRRAVGISILGGAIIPIGDGIVVLRHSSTPLEFLPLHWGGAIACLAFGLFLLRPRADSGESEAKKGT